MIRLVSVLVSAIAIAACSSSSGGTSGATGGADSGSSGDDTTSDSGTTTGNDAGVVTTGDTVTLTMGPFDVPAGTEVFKCQDFKNPFGGVDQDIIKYESHMTPGSHHMFAFFNTANVDGPVQDCPSGGFEFHPYPFTAQTPDAVLTYPETVGSLVPATMGFRLNAHYINAGATTKQGTLTVTFHKAPSGSVTQHAGVIFMNDIGLTVPPGISTSQKSCNLPAGLNIMGASSHMHQRATDFTAKTGDGTMLYETTQWSDPVARVFSPAMALTKATTVTWGCTYDNETNQTLTFGEFAATNVMCIFEMSYYPVANPKNPTIECEAQ